MIVNWSLSVSSKRNYWRQQEERFPNWLQRERLHWREENNHRLPFKTGDFFFLKAHYFIKKIEKINLVRYNRNNETLDNYITQKGRNTKCQLTESEVGRGERKIPLRERMGCSHSQIQSLRRRVVWGNHSKQFGGRYRRITFHIWSGILSLMQQTMGEIGTSETWQKQTWAGRRQWKLLPDFSF